jgi:hypothetical protein
MVLYAVNQEMFQMDLKKSNSGDTVTGTLQLRLTSNLGNAPVAAPAASTSSANLNPLSAGTMGANKMGVTVSRSNSNTGTMSSLEDALGPLPSGYLLLI